jgi:hypothetical protein
MHRSVVTHHWTAWWRSHRATSRWITGSGVRHRSGRGGTRVAAATSSALSVALPPLQPAQNAVGPPRRDRMAVKARPQPALILVPAHLACGLLLARLDGIPALGLAGQFLQRGRSRQVAPGVRPLLRLPPGRAFAQPPAPGRCPSLVIRPHRTATNCWRRPPWVPCRQRTVRQGQRGRAQSRASARCSGALAWRCPLTRPSARTPTTYRACRTSKPAKQLGLSPASASATTQRCGTPQARA